MICLNIIALFFIIFTFQIVDNHVSATNAESIVGGYQARPYQFSYHVAIVAKSNQSKSVALICSGGIITENLILSSALCFVNNHGNLKDYEYSIITDTINWRNLKGISALIDRIYLPSDGNYYLNNIAVAKLLSKLDLANSTGISALDIPYPSESFSGTIGIVAGFGSIFPSYLLNNGSSLKLFVDVISILKYSEVQITNETLCVLENKHIDSSKQFCGLMLTENLKQKWGICEKDAGSPLVYQNKVVGLAGMNNKYCDDTVHGLAYTKVSTYAPFINSIINRNPLPGTIVHHNRKHVLHMVASAA